MHPMPRKEATGHYSPHPSASSDLDPETVLASTTFKRDILHGFGGSMMNIAVNRKEIGDWNLTPSLAHISGTGAPTQTCGAHKSDPLVEQVLLLHPNYNYAYISQFGSDCDPASRKVRPFQVHLLLPGGYGCD
ncbi:uncharacterized protein [Narcine bancroftii]|uniref:uncharacterized protein n=1 Tax=Narcine bancroftii TaxID=1343680 RepID=UPI0038314C5F